MLIAAALALAELGPGPLSLDAARGHERSGAGWALAAAGAGALGALGAQLTTKLQPGAEAFKNASAGSTPVAAPAPAASSEHPATTTAEAA